MIKVTKLTSFDIPQNENGIEYIKDIPLNEILQYIPYNLKFYVFDEPDFYRRYIDILCPNGEAFVTLTIENLKQRIYDERYKPVLRPLSDILHIKEIEYDFSTDHDPIPDNIKRDFNVVKNYITYKNAVLCFKHKIDMFNWIERGLAHNIHDFNLTDKEMKEFLN